MIRKPTIELQSLLITQIRQVNTQSDHFKLNNLIKGFTGEREFDQWVEKYGKTNWIHLKDMRLSAGAPTQIDSMLLTPSGIYIYDIKNYDTKCSYFNKEFLINEKKAKRNIFIQANLSLERIETVLNAINYQGPIHFYIVFINEHCQFSCDPDSRTKHIMRNELRDHFSKINRAKSHHHDLNILKTKLLNYQVDNPYDKAIIRLEQMNKMKLGLYCQECLSFDIDFQRYKCVCQNCESSQTKISVLKQLLSEAGILKFGQSIYRTDLFHLSDKQFTKLYLSKNLSKIAQLNYNGPRSNYKNPNELSNWEKLILQFQL